MQTHQTQDQVSSSTHQESPGQLPPSRLCYMAGARCCAAFLLNPATCCFGQGVWSTRAHGALQWSGRPGSPCQLQIWPCIIKRDVQAKYTVFLIGVGDIFIGLLARMSGTGETVGSAPKWCWRIHMQEVEVVVGDSGELRARRQSSAVHKAEYWTT